MGGCEDVNGAQITITNSQLGRLVEAGGSNDDLQFLYEPQADGSGQQLTGHVCRVTEGPFQDAIIADANALIVGTYDNGALNWGSFTPSGISANFFGEEVNVATNALGRTMAVLGAHQWTPEAAGTIRGILGTEPGNDPQYRVYFDTATGAMAINVDMLIPTRDLIRHLNSTDASELAGISEEQREYLVDSLSAEFIAKHHQDPIEPTFWDQMGGYAVEIVLGVTSLLGVSAAFGVAVPWFSKWWGPKGGAHGETAMTPRRSGTEEAVEAERAERAEAEPADVEQLRRDTIDARVELIRQDIVERYPDLNHESRYGRATRQMAEQIEMSWRHADTSAGVLTEMPTVEFVNEGMDTVISRTRRADVQSRLRTARGRGREETRERSEEVRGRSRQVLEMSRRVF